MRAGKRVTQRARLPGGSAGSECVCECVCRGVGGASPRRRLFLSLAGCLPDGTGLLWVSPRSCLLEQKAVGCSFGGADAVGTGGGGAADSESVTVLRLGKGAHPASSVPPNTHHGPPGM